MDRNAYLNEDFGQSDPNYQERDYRNFGDDQGEEDGESPDQGEQKDTYQQYYQDEFQNGEGEEKELEDLSPPNRNTLETPASTNYLAAPKFAPIDMNQAKVEQEIDQKIKESYCKKIEGMYEISLVLK